MEKDIHWRYSSPQGPSSPLWRYHSDDLLIFIFWMAFHYQIKLTLVTMVKTASYSTKIIFFITEYGKWPTTENTDQHKPISGMAVWLVLASGSWSEVTDGDLSRPGSLGAVRCPLHLVPVPCLSCQVDTGDS